MVPRNSNSGVLTSITGPSGAVAFTVDIIKGVQYAFFTATAGTFTATYTADTTRPTVTSFSPATGATGVSPSATVTATFSEPMDPTTITTTNVSIARCGQRGRTVNSHLQCFNSVATLAPSESAHGLVRV